MLLNEEPSVQDRSFVGLEADSNFIYHDGVNVTFKRYRATIPGKVTYALLCLVTLGAMWLACRWMPKLWIRIVCVPVPHGNEGDVMLAKNDDGSVQLLPVEQLQLTQDVEVPFVSYRHAKYVQVGHGDGFKRASFNTSVPFALIHEQASQTLSESERALRRCLLGNNTVAVPVPSFWALLTDEVLNPFYIFQLFSVILWCFDDYYQYSIAIFTISAISALFEARQSQNNLRNIRDMAQFSCTVTRLCNGTQEDVDSSDLVPGDTILVSKGMTVPCDMALLDGECVVDEAMLTGESIPVVKSALPLHAEQPDHAYAPSDDLKYTLLGGTCVVQATPPGGEGLPRAFVVRTGFSTSKGELVRSILYPQPISFKFYSDSFKFLGVLFGIALLGFVYTIYYLIQWDVEWTHIVIRCLDLVTISVPPALPIALSIGVIFAVSRLKSAGISCIAPNRVNLGGRINRFCFDKTGTITSDGLDVRGAIGCSGGSFLPLETCITAIRSRLMAIFASCHALVMVDGACVGDPLEIKMFESTGWIIGSTSSLDSSVGELAHVLDPKKAFMLNSTVVEKLGIIRRFDFSSRVQRMGVIVREGVTRDEEQGRKDPIYEYFVKGAPEVIAQLCNPASLPGNFGEELERLTQCGYRVIACASRELSAELVTRNLDTWSREDLEVDLRFEGLLVLENKPKPCSAPVIKELQDANVVTVLVTGDNVLTAVNVAQQVGMLPPEEPVDVIDVENGFVVCQSVPRAPGVDQRRYALPSSPGGVQFQWEHLDHGILALTGKAFQVLRELDAERFDAVAVRTRVFARMFPDQKQELIELYRALGDTVGMCGDGSNDCGALKAADAGISLSEAEASIAAPFTSRDPSIRCVSTLLKEGRCALVTSFTDFKFMASYSLIQTISTLMLYYISSVFSGWEFLYIDLFLILPLAWALSRTGAYRKLDKLRPTERLVSVSVISSLLLQTAVNLLVQVWAWVWLHREEWFVPLAPDRNSDNFDCTETTTIFLVSSYQYIFSVLAFCFIGKPYRQPFYTNVAFVMSLVLMTAVTVYLTISPHEWINDLMGMVEVPTSWRWNIILIAVVNLVLLLATEAAIVELFVRRRVQHSLGWKSSAGAGKISSARRYESVTVVVESNVEENVT